ncbi:MAG: hypothetical protein GY836_18210, partial [Herbaspirillum sp.]|uniref:Calx-beta domain-containing protein n=1 Tax=Herbaspirillum sp. TaxID=1890675 RepID=UPI00258A61F3
SSFFVDEVAINACPDLTVPPELWIADRTVVEGDADSELVLTVRLSHPWSQEVSVAYTTVDATAVAGIDYQHRAATLALPAGDVEAAITVPIHGDLDAEGDESFLVRLSDAGNATLVDAEATVTLVDDDPRLAIADATVTEGDHGYANAAFTVSLTPPSSLTVTVDYSLAGATATAGEDFDSRPGTLVFAPG